MKKRKFVLLLVAFLCLLGNPLYALMKVPSKDVSVNVSEFNQNLSSTDTTVQKSLETLDDMNLVTDMSSLSDTEISSLSDGQLLKYYGTPTNMWRNWTPNYLTSYTETDPYALYKNGTVPLTGDWLTSASDKKVQFRSTDCYIQSNAAGELTITCPVSVKIGAPGNVKIGEVGTEMMYPYAGGVVNLGSATYPWDYAWINHITGSLTGNASTATALAVNGSNCSAGQAPLGVDASGGSEGCFAVLTSESDPQVGAVTNAKWCAGNGSSVECDKDAPVLTEVDPTVDSSSEILSIIGAGAIPSSNINWNDINSLAPIQQGGVNWNSLSGAIQSLGLNWDNINSLAPIQQGGMNWSSTFPDCQDTSGNHVNYNLSTNEFSCGNSSSGSGVTSVTGAPPITSTGGTTPEIGMNWTAVSSAINSSAINWTDLSSLKSIKDTMIDFGTGASQVSTDDVTQGSSNLYSTLSNIQTALSSDFHNVGGTDANTTYTAGGTILQLVGTTFSLKEGTLTTTKGCQYVSGTGIVCDQDYLTGLIGSSGVNWTSISLLAPILAGSYGAATIDGDDVNSSLAGRSLTLSSGSPDVLNADAELYTRAFNYTLENPTALSDNKPQITPENAFTITKICCSTDTGTVTANWDERVGTTPNTAGTAILSADLVCDTNRQCSCASGCDVNTITNSSIAAQAVINPTVTSVASSPALAYVVVVGTYDD